MNASMEFHSTVIFVSDIEKSKDFYIRFLGQMVKHDFGKNVIFESGITLWEIDNKHKLYQNSKKKDNSNTFELYFVTKELDILKDKLKFEKVSFVHDIHEEPWGQRTFRFFDPDEHLIEIGEPLEIWINNLNKRGLSAEQIVEKTGVPYETVVSIIS